MTNSSGFNNRVGNMAGNSTPPPPFDVSDFDYHSYMDDISTFEQHFTEDPAFYPTTITYSLAFIVGVLGNTLVVFALLADKKARNVTCSFMVSLAVADLIFLFLCVPYEISFMFASYWSGGLIFCKLSAFVEMLSGESSILNLMAVSVERYIVIVHPMKSRTWCTMGTTKKIILAIWVVSFLLSAPLLHIMDTKVELYYNNQSHIITVLCMDSNVNSNEERLVFSWYQFLVMVVIPTVVMVYCYAFVIRVLWLSTKELERMTRMDSSTEENAQYRPGSVILKSPTSGGGRSPLIEAAVRDQSADIREARKQVIKMLLTIIAIFLICWGPKWILKIMIRHELRVLHSDSAFYFKLLIHLLPYIQSAMNPLIYGIMSKNFRQSIRRAFRLQCHCDPFTCKRVPKPRSRFALDLETKSTNGISRNSMSSPTNIRDGKTYATVLSEC